MAIAIAALLTLALLIAIPAALVALEVEAARKRRDFRENILPALKAADAARRAARGEA